MTRQIENAPEDFDWLEQQMKGASSTADSSGSGATERREVRALVAASVAGLLAAGTIIGGVIHVVSGGIKVKSFAETVQEESIETNPPRG